MHDRYLHVILILLTFIPIYINEYNVNCLLTKIKKKLFIKAFVSLFSNCDLTSKICLSE